MIESSLRAVAVLTSLVVLAGFALFAIDQFGVASQDSQAGIEGSSAPARTMGAEPGQRPTVGLRHALDSADDVLLTPFEGLVDGRGEWAARGIPTVLALLIYGLGLGYLARFAHGRA